MAAKWRWRCTSTCILTAFLYFGFYFLLHFAFPVHFRYNIKMHTKSKKYKAFDKFPHPYRCRYSHLLIRSMMWADRKQLLQFVYSVPHQHMLTIHSQECYHVLSEQHIWLLCVQRTETEQFFHIHLNFRRLYSIWPKLVASQRHVPPIQLCANVNKIVVVVVVVVSISYVWISEEGIYESYGLSNTSSYKI